MSLLPTQACGTNLALAVLCIRFIPWLHHSQVSDYRSVDWLDWVLTCFMLIPLLLSLYASSVRKLIEVMILTVTQMFLNSVMCILYFKRLSLAQSAYYQSFQSLSSGSWKANPQTTYRLMINSVQFKSFWESYWLLSPSEWDSLPVY